MPKQDTTTLPPRLLVSTSENAFYVRVTSNVAPLVHPFSGRSMRYTKPRCHILIDETQTHRDKTDDYVRRGFLRVVRPEAVTNVSKACFVHLTDNGEVGLANGESLVAPVMTIPAFQKDFPGLFGPATPEPAKTLEPANANASGGGGSGGGNGGNGGGGGNGNKNNR